MAARTGITGGEEQRGLQPDSAVSLGSAEFIGSPSHSHGSQGLLNRPAAYNSTHLPITLLLWFSRTTRRQFSEYPVSRGRQIFLRCSTETRNTWKRVIMGPNIHQVDTN